MLLLGVLILDVNLVISVDILRHVLVVATIVAFSIGLWLFRLLFVVAVPLGSGARKWLRSLCAERSFVSGLPFLHFCELHVDAVEALIRLLHQLCMFLDPGLDLRQIIVELDLVRVGSSLSPTFQVIDLLLKHVGIGVQFVCVVGNLP